jgi:exopolysaccharide production protein ExoQ
MGTQLATIVCAVGILGLFYLNRDNSVRTSQALWIPSIWFLILASRPVTMWFGDDLSGPTLAQQIDGSPTERLIYSVLIAAGLAVLVYRGRRAFSLLTDNWPIVLYFSYCLLSVVWSDYPDVAFKRWIKATGDIVMVLVIVTDAKPLAALQRLFSRIGFVLLPASVLLIKYYPAVGRMYDSWTGDAYNTGVATNKNSLGLLAYLIGLGALWSVLRLWRDRDVLYRSRRLIAQGVLLGFAVYLSVNAHSATAGTSFTIGAFVLMVTGLHRIRSRSSAMHTVVISSIILGVLIQITGANALVLQIIGRNPDLTGRADYIWPTVIPMNPNFLLGAGFESFWLGPRLQFMWDKFPHLFLNEAHNGYIEMYLNLGLIGVALIALVLIDGYRRSVAAFRADPDAGNLMLAYTLTAPLYSMTEAGFRMLAISWSFLLLAIIGSTRISQLPAEKTQLDQRPFESMAWAPRRAGTISARVKT